MKIGMNMEVFTATFMVLSAVEVTFDDNTFEKWFIPRNEFGLLNENTQN